MCKDTKAFFFSLAGENPKASRIAVLVYWSASWFNQGSCAWPQSSFCYCAIRFFLDYMCELLCLLFLHLHTVCYVAGVSIIFQDKLNFSALLSVKMLIYS